MITIGITWEKWTPKIESCIVLDALNVQGLSEVYWYADPKEQDSAEISKCSRIFAVAGIKLNTELPELTNKMFDAWKIYYEDEKPAVNIQARKIFYKCLKQEVKRIVLRPNAGDHVVFPVVEWLAPPATLPQNKVPPPRGPSVNNLPWWAWTN